MILLRNMNNSLLKIVSLKAENLSQYLLSMNPFGSSVEGNDIDE